MRVRLLVRLFLVILLVLTFLYQYVRLDKCVSYIVQHKATFASTYDHAVYLTGSERVLSEVQEGLLHSRGMLGFQTALFIFILLEMNLGRRKEGDAGRKSGSDR